MAVIDHQAGFSKLVTMNNFAVSGMVHAYASVADGEARKSLRKRLTP